MNQALAQTAEWNAHGLKLSMAINLSPGLLNLPSLVQEVSTLRQQITGDIVVYGSGQLARTLVEHDLVDELRLMTHPFVVGAGDRLFGETGEKKPLRLVDIRAVGDGLVLLTYQPVRP